MRISKRLAAVALAGFVSAAPAQAGLQEGIEAYAAGDSAGAIAAWQEGAAQGDATSAYLLAKMYERGLGTAASPKLAFTYLQQAASGGHIQAQVELGDYYRNGVPEADVDRDYGAALGWYEKAALVQHAEAQSKIGEMYFLGQGVERNRFDAIRWYRLAAQKYYAPALIHLSNAYWANEPVPQDKARSYAYLLLARQSATDETRPDVDALMAQREPQMSRAELDAGVRLAEAFRLEHPRR